MKTSSDVTISVIFNGKILIQDKMSQERITKQLKEGFKTLMGAINMLTKVEGRKGLTHIFQIDDQKTSFKGGSLGSSMVRALILNQMAETGKFDIDDHKEIVKLQIATLPISGRTVEAIRVFDKFIDGKAMHSDVKKVLLPPAEPKKTKAETIAAPL